MSQFERIKDFPEPYHTDLSPDGVFNHFDIQEGQANGSLKSLNSPNLCLGRHNRSRLGGSRIPCRMNLRTLVRALASIDVVYALLLLGLHLLVLITGGSKSKVPNTDKPDHSVTMTSSTDHPNLSSPDSGSDLELINSNASQKSQERIAVLIWIGMFAICILQLLVAGALYGGTNERDGRICIRNCRIWSYTTSFLISIILFQLCGIFIIPGKETVRKHIVALSVYFVELICRVVGLIVIHKFIKEVKYELCDLDMDEHVVYYELQPPVLTPPKVNHHNRHGHHVQSHYA